MAAGAFRNFKSENHTRNINMLVSWSNLKFAQSLRHNVTAFR